MKYDVLFFAQSALLGSGLATDAFSVSLADGLREPDMEKGKACLVAGVFTGKKFGLKFREKATVAGGIILVIIFVRHRDRDIRPRHYGSVKRA